MDGEVFHKNPSGDIYRIMDESGLTLANLQRTDRSQTKTVQDVRLELHNAIKKYIKYRESHIGSGPKMDTEEVKI